MNRNGVRRSQIIGQSNVISLGPLVAWAAEIAIWTRTSTAV